VPQAIAFALTGERFEVEWRNGKARAVEQHGGRIIVHAPDEVGALTSMQRWLKSAAGDRLVPRLMQLAADLNYSIARVAIRCQRTRWGSCSTRGTLSLNCSLVFLRPEVVRYLFVHEMAHTKHMNHSAAFWHLVEQLEPDYRCLDRELLDGWRTVPLWVFNT
jgi:predicted metal-dependent hydrolase